MMAAEKKQCEKILAAVCAEKAGAREALSRWIETQPGYDFSRTRTLGELMPEERFAAALDDVEPLMQLLDVGCPQNPVREAGVEALNAWFATHPKQAPARAKRILDIAATTPRKQREWRTATLVCLPFVKSVGKDHDALVAELCSVYLQEHEEKVVVAALATMPIARRDACFDTSIANGTIHRLTDGMLKLASKQLLARVKKHEEAATKKGQEEAKAEKAAKAAAPFRFVDPVRVMPSDYAKLDEIGKAQYRIAAGGYVDSGKVRDPKDFIRQLKKEELDESDAELRRWKVMRGKEHVYDMWIVWVENGTFFLAGTQTQLPVYITQGSYLPRDKNTATKKLALDLARSERKSLWSR